MSAAFALGAEGVQIGSRFAIFKRVQRIQILKIMSSMQLIHDINLH